MGGCLSDGRPSDEMTALAGALWSNLHVRAGRANVLGTIVPTDETSGSNLEQCHAYTARGVGIRDSDIPVANPWRAARSDLHIG